MTTRHFSPEEKLTIIQELIQGASPSHLCTKYQVHDDTLRIWRKKYEKHGTEGLKKQNR